MLMIDPARDVAGLRQAAVEMMEESMDAEAREQIERVAAMAANGEALLAALPARRTLSPGYYMWIEYVLEVIVEMESGVEFREQDLRIEEVAGLTALRQARGEFRKLHPPCGDCGKALAQAGLSHCPECEMARANARRGY